MCLLPELLTQKACLSVCLHRKDGYVNVESYPAHGMIGLWEAVVLSPAFHPVPVEPDCASRTELNTTEVS